MTETNEREGGAADVQESNAGGQESHGRAQEGAGADDGGLSAEEESAKAMEAEVPHPAGYPDPGQEQPS